MTALPSLLVVVRRLGQLRDRAVFVGGAIRGLLVTDPGAAQERPTDDVDLVVDVASLVHLHRFEAGLRVLGFQQDATPGAPMCRWIVDGVRVDVMPTEGTILGFKNRWYGEAVSHSVEILTDGERFRIVDAPHFCATKLDAYADRGSGDLYHHDLEDVIAVIGAERSFTASSQRPANRLGAT